MANPTVIRRVRSAKVIRLEAELAAADATVARLRATIERERRAGELACDGCKRGRCVLHGSLFAELEL